MTTDDLLEHDTLDRDLPGYDALKRRAWAGRAQAYAETFGALCAHPIELLLDAGDVRPGTAVLDVGTGTGAVAAAALARGARVTAVDPDADMRRLARRSAPGATVLTGSLPELGFADGSFDVVVANFVLNHVGDPWAGAAELARVTGRGGRVAVSVWPRPVSELHRLWDDVVDAAQIEPAPGVATLDPGREFERTPAGLAQLLTHAGLRDVEAKTVPFVHHVDAELWWSGPARGVASIGSLVEAQTPAAARMKEQFDRLSRRYLGTDGLLHLPTAAVVGHGTMP